MISQFELALLQLEAKVRAMDILKDFILAFAEPELEMEEDMDGAEMPLMEQEAEDAI